MPTFRSGIPDFRSTQQTCLTVMNNELEASHGQVLPSFGQLNSHNNVKLNWGWQMLPSQGTRAVSPPWDYSALLRRRCRGQPCILAGGVVGWLDTSRCCCRGEDSRSVVPEWPAMLLPVSLSAYNAARCLPWTHSSSLCPLLDWDSLWGRCGLPGCTACMQGFVLDM